MYSRRSVLTWRRGPQTPVEEVVLSWVQILCKDSLSANVRLDEHHSTLHDASLEDLLGVIDETERLLQGRKRVR